MVTIIMNDYPSVGGRGARARARASRSSVGQSLVAAPQAKFVMIGILAFFVLVNREEG